MSRPSYFTMSDTAGRGFVIITVEGRGTDRPGGTRLFVGSGPVAEHAEELLAGFGE